MRRMIQRLDLVRNRAHSTAGVGDGESDGMNPLSIEGVVDLFAAVARTVVESPCVGGDCPIGAGRGAGVQMDGQRRVIN